MDGAAETQGSVSWRWLAVVAVGIVVTLSGSWALNVAQEVAAQEARQDAIEKDHAVMGAAISSLQTSLGEIKASVRLIEEDMRHVRRKLDGGL